MGKNISAHGSSRGDERRPCAVRYGRTIFDTIIDNLIQVQVWRSNQQWDAIVIMMTTYAKGPSGTLLLDGVLSRWTDLSELPVRTPHTGTILDVRAFALLVRGHGLLESRAKTFCNGRDLQNEESI